MGRITKVAALVAALALLVAACSSDEETPATPEGTSAPATSPATAPPATIPTTTVVFEFRTPVTADQAEQAASTMERRLVKFRELEGESAEGAAVSVTDDGTGLEITVPGASDDAEANGVVETLSFRGNLYFRPGLEEYPSPDAPDQTPTAPQGAGTTVPGTDVPGTTSTTAAPSIPDLTPEADDDPLGTSVLPWRDFETVTELQNPSDVTILSIWSVGPAALAGTAVEDSEVTTQDGNPAVKVVLADTADGLIAFNDLAEACFNKDASCPTGGYAVALDSQIVVVSAPRGGQDQFTPFTQDDVIIWSSEWTEDVAIVLAVAFEAGALPVDLVPAT